MVTYKTLLKTYFYVKEFTFNFPNIPLQMLNIKVPFYLYLCCPWKPWWTNLPVSKFPWVTETLFFSTSPKNKSQRFPREQGFWFYCTTTLILHGPYFCGLAGPQNLLNVFCMSVESITIFFIFISFTWFPFLSGVH
jgi:hypothetical protein